MANAKPSQPQTASKKQQIIKLLEQSKGASLEDIRQATGWQIHSIRGFMSGTLKKQMKIEIVSFKDKKGIRRYRILTGVNEAIDQPANKDTIENTIPSMAV